MPGPMGGGRGGGFSGGSRGGSFGGGSHGGGFHGGPRGPMHHGPHHHHHGPIFMGPMFGRRRYWGGGGGCLGGLLSALVAPIILLIFVAALIIGALSGTLKFTDITYDEQTFQQYADAQYYEVFSDAGAHNYENNILLVFLVYDGYEGYDCIAWGGNNIDSETEELFGSYFKSTVNRYIPAYYEYGFTKAFRDIVKTMTNAAPAKSTAEPVDTSHSVLYNHTELSIDNNTVNAELQKFTEKTGYSIAIVLENGAEVFGKESDGGDNFDVVFVVIFITIAAVLIFAFIKTKKDNGGGGGTSSTTDKTNPNSGQGKYDPNTGEWK